MKEVSNRVKEAYEASEAESSTRTFRLQPKRVCDTVRRTVE